MGLVRQVRQAVMSPTFWRASFEMDIFIKLWTAWQVSMPRDLFVRSVEMLFSDNEACWARVESWILRKFN